MISATCAKGAGKLASLAGYSLEAATKSPLSFSLASKLKSGKALAIIIGYFCCCSTCSPAIYLKQSNSLLRDNYPADCYHYYVESWRPVKWVRPRCRLAAGCRSRVEWIKTQTKYCSPGLARDCHSFVLRWTSREQMRRFLGDAVLDRHNLRKSR